MILLKTGRLMMTNISSLTYRLAIHHSTVKWFKTRCGLFFIPMLCLLQIILVHLLCVMSCAMGRYGRINISMIFWIKSFLSIIPNIWLSRNISLWLPGESSLILNIMESIRRCFGTQKMKMMLESISRGRFFMIRIYTLTFLKERKLCTLELYRWKSYAV